MDPIPRFRQLLTLAADEASSPAESKSAIRAALKMLEEKTVILGVRWKTPPPQQVIPIISEEELRRKVAEDFVRDTYGSRYDPVDFLERIARANRAQQRSSPSVSKEGVAQRGARCGRCGKVLEVGDGIHHRPGFHPNCVGCGTPVDGRGSRL